MSENKHIYEIIGKDDFNIKILNETLWDIKESIFRNLYDAQRSLLGMTRFDIDMADMTSITKTRCSYNLNLQFITNNSRTKFKQSKFYKKELSPDEINSNPSIFSNNILLFIDGEMYTNFYIKPIENITTLSFKLFEKEPFHDENIRHLRDGFSRIEMDELINNHAKMTILIVPAHNMSFMESNVGTVRNRTIVPSYNGIPMIDFTNRNMISETDTFTTWITYEDERLYKYRLINAIRSDENTLLLDRNVIESMTNNFINIRNIFLLNHFQTITVPAGTEYFELPIKDMPIPIENLIIFKKSGDVLLFDHNSTITLHYPNIYQINQISTDDLIIYAYYADDTSAIGSKYENELSLYYRFNQNVLENYKDNTIPDIIKNYNPITITYDHDDLNASTLDHIKYKMNKLNSMIYQNGNYYSIYLNKLVGYVPTFDIDVSDINDLNERYRTDNRSDLVDISLYRDFPEPCYMFKFIHKTGTRYNILIDDYQTNELYIYYDKKYCFIYIPVRLIYPNSLITVDKYVDYIYKQPCTIADTYTYNKIDIPDDQEIQISDIYLTTNVDDEYMYMNKNDYIIYVYVNNNYEPVTINDFYKYKRIYVKFTNPDNIGKTVYINVNRTSFKQVVKGINEVIINREINNDERNILLYYNGRLIPQAMRKYEFAETVNGPHIIKSSMQYHPDDEFTVVYNTNKYFMVYFQRRINTKGIVNLTGKINKPLDFKWYDIYLNGLRLHKSNIEIIGPYIFLLKDVPTLTNLEIYQKNLDSLTWDNCYDTDDISSKIFDEICDDIADTLPDIEDIIPDIIDSSIVELIEFFDEYLWDYIKLINPDMDQITERMINKYPTVFVDDKNLFLDPDLLRVTESNMLLNPDENTILMN